MVFAQSIIYDSWNIILYLDGVIITNNTLGDRVTGRWERRWVTIYQHLSGWHCTQFSIWLSNSSICRVQSKKLYFMYIFLEASFSTVVVFTPGSVEHRYGQVINAMSMSMYDSHSNNACVYDYLLTARWAAKAILSGLSAHTLRLCTLTTPSILMNVSRTSVKLTPFGIPSINTTIVSRIMLNVVTSTSIEKKNVHIGSTIFHSG